jgi:hypothetical protein
MEASTDRTSEALTGIAAEVTLPRRGQPGSHLKLHPNPANRCSKGEIRDREVEGPVEARSRLAAAGPQE